MKFLLTLLILTYFAFCSALLTGVLVSFWNPDVGLIAFAAMFTVGLLELTSQRKPK